MYNPNTGFRLKKDEKESFLRQKWTISGDPKYLVPPNDIKENYIKGEYYLLNTKWHTNNKTRVINPDTGKTLAYRTALKKNEFDIRYHDKKISLIPKNKWGYEKTIDQKDQDSYWLKKGTTAYNTAAENDMFQVKKVYLPNMDEKNNPIMVAIDSPQFESMINDGFTYDEKQNLLRYPKYEMVVEVKFPVSTADVKAVLDENPRTLTLVVGERYNIPVGTLTETTKFINKVFYYKDHIGELHGSTGGHHVKFGIAFQGIKNCVIQALEVHCEKYNYGLALKFAKLYKKYKYGVYGQDYHDISKTLQLQIKVFLPKRVNAEQQVFGKKSYKRAMFECEYENNHITERTINTVDKPVVWSDTLPYTDINNIVNVCGDFKKPTRIEYKDRILRLNSETIFDERTDDDYVVNYKNTNTTTVISYFTRKFTDQNNIKPVRPQNYNIDAIKSICQHGIMFSKPLKKGPMVLLDIKNAYDTYEKCTYYNKFPTDLTWCIKTTDMDFSKICDLIVHEGFAYVKMVCYWTKKDIERWISMPYLRYYMAERKDPISIEYMILSTGRTDLNLDNINIQKRIWHKVLGNMTRTTCHVTWVTTDGLIAGSTDGGVEEISIPIEGVKGTAILYRKHVSIDKTSTQYFPHITGYVQAYTEIRMEKTLTALSIDVDDISRVWVDGVYIQKRMELPVLPEWHVGLLNVDEKDPKFEYEIELKYKAVEPCYFSDTFEDRLTTLGKDVMVQGVGGTGKSYLLRKLYNQCPNSIILVPTNELKKRFMGTNVETIDMVIARRQFNQFNTVFLDEYGIVAQEKLDMLRNALNIDLLVVFGDTGQLTLLEGTPIVESNFDILILEKIFRQYNPVFQQKLNNLRKTGEFKFKQTVDAKNAIEKKYIILSATKAECDRLNNLGFALNPSDSVRGIKTGSPVRFYKSAKGYSAGETGHIVSIDKNIIITKEDGNKVTLPVEQFKKYHKLAYSMTYHCVQGKTVSDRNIVINTKNLFDPQMKYVGCSRVVKEEQLFLLIG